MHDVAEQGDGQQHIYVDFFSIIKQYHQALLVVGFGNDVVDQGFVETELVIEFELAADRVVQFLDGGGRFQEQQCFLFLGLQLGFQLL